MSACAPACMGAGVYDHGYALAYERLTDHDPDPEPAASPALAHPRQADRHCDRRHRAAAVLCRQRRARRDAGLGGARLRGQLRRQPRRPHGRRDQQRRRLSHGDRAERGRAGRARDPRRANARRRPAADRRRATSASGSRPARAIAKVKGRGRVEGVAVAAQAGEGAVLDEIACDAVAMSGGWSPVVHLWSHCGGKLTWDEAQAHFRPDPDQRPDRGRWRGFRASRRASPTAR